MVHGRVTLMKTTLDLGCGREPKNPFAADQAYGIDVAGEESEFRRIADLSVEPIPFPDESFDFVTAHDFLEHVPRVLYVPQRRNPFIELMNEVYRVLKTGGVFFSFTPAYPHGEAFQDPTHVNILTEQTFRLYFDDENRWAKMYGFTGAFRILQQGWRPPHLLTLMQKVPLQGAEAVPPVPWRLAI